MVLAAIGCGFGARFLDPQQALCTKPLGAGSPTVVVFSGSFNLNHDILYEHLQAASHAEVCTSCVLTTSWQPGMFLVSNEKMFGATSISTS